MKKPVVSICIDRQICDRWDAKCYDANQECVFSTSDHDLSLILDEVKTFMEEKTVKTDLF